jgi:hypothetical protein
MASRYSILFVAVVGALGCSSSPAASSADAGGGADSGSASGSCYGPTPSNNTPECPAGYCFVCALLDVNPRENKHLGGCDGWNNGTLECYQCG